MKGKYLIYKGRNFSTSYTINFKKLISDRLSDSSFTDLNVKKKTDNKDFGEYTVQVKYYRSGRDTIYSNVLRVIYVNL